MATVYGTGYSIGQGYYRSGLSIWGVSETTTTYTYKVQIFGQLKNIDGWSSSRMWLGTWNGSSYDWTKTDDGNMYCSWSSDWKTTNFNRTYTYTVNKGTTGSYKKYYKSDIQCGSGTESIVEGYITIPVEGTAPTITQSVVPTSATTVALTAISNVDCNLWRYSLDNGSWTDFSSASGRTGTGTLTVTEGTHTVKLAGRKSTNSVWGIPDNPISIDTRLAVVTATIDEPTTDSFSFTASTNYDCNLWEYSIDNGSNWVTFSTTDGTSASGTVSNLTVNTNYTILIRAKRTANNLYSRNATYSVKTQGGIMHVNVNGSWKEAIAYVKIGSAWKQVICYTKVGSSWRINT